MIVNKKIVILIPFYFLCIIAFEQADAKGVYERTLKHLQKKTDAFVIDQFKKSYKEYPFLFGLIDSYLMKGFTYEDADWLSQQILFIFRLDQKKGDKLKNNFHSLKFVFSNHANYVKEKNTVNANIYNRMMIGEILSLALDFLIDLSWINIITTYEAQGSHLSSIMEDSFCALRMPLERYMKYLEPNPFLLLVTSQRKTLGMDTDLDERFLQTFNIEMKEVVLRESLTKEVELEEVKKAYLRIKRKMGAECVESACSEDKGHRESFKRRIPAKTESELPKAMLPVTLHDACSAEASVRTLEDCSKVGVERCSPTSRFHRFLENMVGCLERLKNSNEELIAVKQQDLSGPSLFKSDATQEYTKPELLKRLKKNISEIEDPSPFSDYYSRFNALKIIYERYKNVAGEQSKFSRKAEGILTDQNEFYQNQFEIKKSEKEEAIYAKRIKQKGIYSDEVLKVSFFLLQMFRNKDSEGNLWNIWFKCRNYFYRIFKKQRDAFEMRDTFPPMDKRTDYLDQIPDEMVEFAVLLFKHIIERLKSDCSYSEIDSEKKSLPINKATAVFSNSNPKQYRNRVVWSAKGEFDQSSEILAYYTLNPAPKDHYCFYHSIGEHLGMDGLTFFNQLVTLARWLLGQEPDLAAMINRHLQNAGSSLDEVVALGYVEYAGQQLWGHTGLLPLISWWYQQPIVVLDYRYADQAGALLFTEDGAWTFIAPENDSIMAPLSRLQRIYPHLLILNNSNESHWDTLTSQRRSSPRAESRHTERPSFADLLESMLGHMNHF